MSLPSDGAPYEPGVIRVLVVDDHRMVAEGVTAYLDAAPDVDVIAVAADGEEALAQLRLHDVDVALLDYRLPDMTGDELARRLLAESPGIRVIMISADEEDAVAAAAIAAGCHGFLPKGRSGTAALIDAIRAVHKGVAVFDPTTVVRAIPYLRRRHNDTPTSWDLTAREREVLGCLAEGSTTSEIARALDISPVTVRNHIQRILSKLNAHSRLEAVSMGIRAGVLPAYALPGIDTPSLTPLPGS